MVADALTEPGAQADPVDEDGVRHDERADALSRHDQLFAGEGRQRLAHGIAVHAETCGHLGLSWQSSVR